MRPSTGLFGRYSAMLGDAVGQSASDGPCLQGAGDIPGGLYLGCIPHRARGAWAFRVLSSCLRVQVCAVRIALLGVLGLFKSVAQRGEGTYALGSAGLYFCLTPPRKASHDRSQIQGFKPN
jgi:hypothetical protein